MPAYFDSGFFYRKPAWHGEGNVTDKRPESWDEARREAGIEWEPIEAPSYGFQGIRELEDGSTVVVHEPGEGVIGDYMAEPGSKRVLRSDTGATLGIANKSWTLITHAQMGDVADALGFAGLSWETAGATHGGRKVWGLGYLDEPFNVQAVNGRADTSLSLPYISLLNSHDGSGSLRVGYTQVRIVCANTWQMSEGEQEQHGHTFVFRHTKNWQDKVAEAKDALAGLRRDKVAYEARMSHLLGVPVSLTQRELFVREFVPMPPDGIISDRVARNVEEARQALRMILDSETVAGAGVGDSAYGLVMAATEYLDHVRGYRNRDTLLGRQVLSREPLKAKAAKLALQVAGVG